MRRGARDSSGSDAACGNVACMIAHTQDTGYRGCGGGQDREDHQQPERYMKFVSITITRYDTRYAHFQVTLFCSEAFTPP